MGDKQRLSIKAIVLGVVVDPAVTLLAMLAYLMNLDRAGLAPEQIEGRFRDPNGLAFALVAGFAATVLAGYVTARVARHRELAHATATAIVLMVGNVLIWLVSLALGSHETVGEHYPMRFTVFAYGSTLPCALLGGWLAKRVHARLAAAKPTGAG